MENRLINELKTVHDALDRSHAAKEITTMYADMIKRAKPVTMSKMSDVFGERELDKIMRCVRPEPNRCYKNSLKLASLFDGIRDIRYCEGRVWVCNMSVEHAFCVVDNRYVDVTIELTLNENPCELEYIVLGEYTPKQVMDVLKDTGTYGDVYKWYWDKMYKNRF